MNSVNRQVTPSRLQRLARLLVNFSEETTAQILQRFDVATQLKVQSQLRELAEAGQTGDAGLLAEFADFLYFKPEAPVAADKSRADRSLNRAVPIQRPDLTTDSAIAAEDVDFREILNFPDEDLDALLKAAPPETTMAVLACSPQSFVNRVLGRLSAEDASLVRQRLQQTGTVDFSQMQEVHYRYCRLASRLIADGRIARPGDQ
jgi:flagellar motor switch protein FliG